MTLAVLPLLRLARSRQAWLWLVSAAGLSLGSAWIERRHAAPHGADHALLNVYASIAVPLLVYALVGAATDGGGLAWSGRGMFRLGASRARLVLVTLVAAAVVSAVVCGALGSAVAALAHGAGDPPAVGDALETLGFGAVGGAAYAAYFGLGAAIGGRRGWGRGALLVVDWVLGNSTDVAASLTPRAHLRNLLGGAAPLDLLPRESLLVIGVLVALCLGAATRLSTGRRARAS